MLDILNIVVQISGWGVVIFITGNLIFYLFEKIYDFFKQHTYVLKANQRTAKAISELENLKKECELIIGVLEHNGDFRSGVTYNGFDEGEMAWSLAFQRFKNKVRGFD